MTPGALICDYAMALARAVLEVVAPALREEERREAFGLFYEAAKAALFHDHRAAGHTLRRVPPGVN